MAETFPYDVPNIEATATSDMEPFDVPVFEDRVKSEALRKEEAMLLTTAETGIDTESQAVTLFRNNYEKLAFASADEIVNTLRPTYIQNEIELAGESAVDPVTAGTYVALREQELSQPTALHQMAMEAISLEGDIFTQAEIANGYAAYEIQKMVENTSTGEDIANFLSDVFLPVATKDRSDFLTEVFGDELNVSFKEAAVDFASKSPEERARLLPAIMKAALDATDGNEARAARLAREFYSLDADQATLDMLFDGLIIGPALFSGLVKTAKTGRMMHSAAKLNKEVAADIMASSVKSTEVAEATGVTQRTVGESVSPFRWADHSVDAIDGIEPEIVRALESAAEETARAVREAEATLIKRSPLTEAEQKAAQLKAMAQFEKESDKLAKTNGWAASNARITKSDEYGFTVEYDLLDANGNPLQAKPHRVNYNKRDVGEYNEGFETSNIGGALHSPSVWANRAQENVVELATAIGFSNERTLQKLMGIANDSIKGLSKKEIGRMDEVLMKGDEWRDAAGLVQGKVFTPKELMYDGLPGVGRLSLKEAEAYYKMRSFWDELHRITDQNVLKEWRFENVRTVGSFNGERVFGNVITKGELPASAKKVMNLSDNNPVDIAGIASRVEKGELEYVKLRRVIDLGDEVYEFGVIPKNSTKPLPVSGAIPKKTGYVPLIRNKSYYFVERQATKLVNGAAGRVPQMVRAFDNQADAAAWAAQEEARTGVKHISRYDREISGDMASDLQQSQFGSPITGSRVQDREILFGWNGTKPERLDSIQAMERNINAVAQTMPMNEFRMAQLTKWHNSARRFLNEPNNPNSGFKATSANRHVAGLKQMKRWLDDQFHVATETEQAWAGTMRQFAEFLEGNAFFKSGKGAGLRKAVHEAAKTDPIGALRGAAFNLLLGAWNPAQLLVQAMGSTLAISLSPQKFPKIWTQQTIMRFGYKKPEAVRAMAKAMGMDGDELVALHNAYERSGIVESLKTSADYNAAALGYGIDQGALQRAWGSAKQGNLVFFREGERFNRSYSWMLAADEYLATNKMKAAKLTDADIDAITSQSLKYTMNMNRANRAEWQKGILSIPTQFWQVNAKFLETVGPRILGTSGNLTGAQKARIMLGQLGLFGAAGIPLGDSLTRGAMDYAGIDANELSDNDIAALRQGLLGAAVQALIGEEVEVSERFAFGSGFNQLLQATVESDATFTEVMLGAAGAVPSRVLQALGAVAPRMQEPEFSASEAAAIAVEFGDIISTFRNAHKAYLFGKLGEIRTADGTLVDTVDWGEDWKMVVAQGLGFAPSRVAEYYDHKQYQRNMAGIRTDAIRALEKNFVQFMSGDISDPEWQKRYHQLESMIMYSIEGVMEQEKLREAWVKKMTQDPQLQKLMNTTMETYFGSDVKQPNALGTGIPLSTFKKVNE